MRRSIDIFSAGELLVDFITAEFAQTLDEASLFQRIPGGSPANLAMNMARLGNNAMLAACVGNDDMGTVLYNYVKRLGVDVTHVSQVEDPTTLILVTRSAAVSNFQPYRGADYQFSIRQFPYQRFEEISIFHTTCFALSKQPAQQVILEAAEKASRAGCQLSIDTNYSTKIWPDTRDAKRVIAERGSCRDCLADPDVHHSRGNAFDQRREAGQWLAIGVTGQRCRYRARYEQQNADYKNSRFLHCQLPQSMA